MLSAATGLVFLPSLDVDAQYQRREITKKSGTATQAATADKSAVQEQVDALYAKYGRPAPNGQKLPSGETGSENIAAKAAPASAVQNAAVSAAKDDSGVRQVSGEVAIPAPSAARRAPAPKRSFFPSLFPRKKSPPPPQVTPSRSVQEHLRKLYAKDGRPMPEMEVGQPLQLPAPGAASTGSAPAELTLPQAASAVPVPQPLPTHSASTPQASPEAEPIRRVSSNPFKRLIQRISPFRRKKKDAPIPAPADVISEQRKLQQDPLNPYYQGEREEDAPSPIEPAPSEPAPLPDLDRGAEEPSLNSAKPALELETVEPSADSQASGLPEFKPLVQLPETPPGAEPAAGSVEEPQSPPTLEVKVSDEPFGVDPKDPLENPFPSLSEEAADDKPAEAEVTPQPVENPFTGLKLEAPADSKETLTNPTSLAPSLSEPKGSDSLEAPELPSLPTVEKPSLEEAGAPKLIIRPTLKPAPKNLPPAESTPAVPEISEPSGEAAPKRQSAQEKMKRIAERAELKGLKGFCPVQLRDERELRDARPQFSAVHEGVVYNFSSAAARQKFLANPESYAPAAGGQDIVLTGATSETIEGSLDYAVWYRNRLYLFDSPASMKSFKASPGKYVDGK